MRDRRRGHGTIIVEHTDGGPRGTRVGGHITGLAEIDIDQDAVAVDRPVLSLNRRQHQSLCQGG